LGPPDAGGKVDVLLGICYNSCVPIPVHVLPSGITIFKLPLASFDEIYDACICGPHDSFSSLGDTAGNSAALIAHFVEGLQRYNEFGPPKIRGPMMTLEDVQFQQSLGPPIVAVDEEIE
jgi:hypothetical protein